MLHTTFAKAHESRACVESYHKMAKSLGGITKYGKDTPIPLDKVIEVCGLQGAIWALRCTIEPSENILIEFACACAEHTLQNYEKLYPDDKRPRNAIQAARDFAGGKISLDKLKSAKSAAKSAAWSAESAAKSAAWSAESAAESAESAAKSAAWSAESAESAAWSAAKSAAWSAESAAWSAAESAEIEWQTQTFLLMLNEGK